MSAPFGRLLIVDDEKPVLDVLSEYFVSQGHAVETAETGAEAIATYRRTAPDLVLLDVRMPGMDGVEVLRRLRVLGSTPVIMVTANEDVALARLTLKLGAFDYVSKPFDFTYLDRAVTAGLVRASEMAEREPATGGDPRRELVRAIFRIVRGMSATGRGSTGTRLEDAAIAAALDGPAARRRLEEIDLLVDVAVELGDLESTDRDRVVSLVAAARKALTGGA